MHPDPQRIEALFPYFMAFWVTAALAAAAFFRFNQNAVLKRKVFPTLTIAADIVFLAFWWYGGVPLPFLLFGVAIALFGSWSAIRHTRFCSACGANNFPQSQFRARSTCKKCGVPLQAVS